MKTSFIASIAFFALAGSAACYAGKVQHDYLEPCDQFFGVNPGQKYCSDPSYADGVGKISVNCDAMTFVFRGHGLLAGRIYQLNSGGDPIDETSNEEAVGSGTAGLGNNVLIKGELYLSDLGGNWNLYDVTDDVEPTETNNRIIVGKVNACQ